SRASSRGINKGAWSTGAIQHDASVERVAQPPRKAARTASKKNRARHTATKGDSPGHE
ncbi:unnamed protein product, partial [Scytosiphon promiscuus]